MPDEVKNLNYMHPGNATPDEIDAAVEDVMTFHKWTDEQVAAGVPVREAAKVFFGAILTHVPPSADRSAALRHVREALYNANGAFTHGGKY